MKTQNLPSVSLYFSEGSSDKEYHANIEQQPTGYVVNFAYGRRGGSLKFGVKTDTPVSLMMAQAIFDELVASKKAKGYTEDESGTPFSTGKSSSNDDSPIPANINPAPKTPATKSDGSRIFAPQLLNPITEEEAERYIADDDYMGQEKKNGQRLSISNDGKGGFSGFNKLGKERPLPKPVTGAIPASLTLQLDGELIGDIFHVFDIISLGGKDFRGMPAIERFKAIDFIGLTGKNVKPIETAKTTAEKRAMFNALKAANAEGMVFKRKDAPYTAGRPERGGPQVKCKFYKTASVVVTKANAKRSVAMGVWDGNKLVNIGNVTIPPNKAIPQKGAFIEVRYLTCIKGGSLYQPTYLEDRSDELEGKDCSIKQLVFNSQGED